ncbi:outer membrane beta-barrel protein, partial [Elizabethkingia sp. HvH-WGS333]
YEIGIDHSYNGNITKWLNANISSGIYYNSFHANDGINNKGASFYNNTYLQMKLSKTFLLELSSNYYHQYQYRNVSGANRYRMDISIRKTLMSGNLLALFKVVDLFNTERDKNISHYKDFNFDFYQKWQTRGFLISVQYTLDNKNKIKAGSVKSDNDSRGRL